MVPIKFETFLKNPMSLVYLLILLIFIENGKYLTPVNTY